MAEFIPDTLDFILQSDLTSSLLPGIGKEQWQVLYANRDEPPHTLGISCALLDEKTAARAIDHDAWDLMIGDGIPGFSHSWLDGKEIITYHRFSSRDGVRPLVLHRSFHGAFPPYVELDEEFRLYHNLAEDKVRGLLLTFDTSGREIEVVRITPNEVRVRLKHLRQFQAGTGLYVAIYIDSIRYSKIALTDIPPNEHQRVEVGYGVRWRRNVVKYDFRKHFETFSRLLSKVILAPPALDKAGVWPFKADDDRRVVTFIVGLDKEGNEIEYTSDPGKLANYFGANPGAPHYLTPISVVRSWRSTSRNLNDIK